MGIGYWVLHAPATGPGNAPIPNTQYLPALLLTILAFGLRIIPWLANYPLHHDEALYGFWARLIASGQDPWLLTAWVDKPPLTIYTLAGSLSLFGVSEQALRLPGMIAGTLLVPATYTLARRAYGPQTGLLAAALVALCPFAISFAPSAFTDPWLTLWLVLAAWAALADRPFWAGLSLGLAVASKQQGVLVAPLIVGLPPTGGLLALPAPRPHTTARSPLLARSGRWLWAVLGFAVIFAPLTWWDSLRWATRPSFWERSLATYGGLGLAPPAAWPARAAAWGRQLGYLFGLPALSALMLLLALGVGVRALARCQLFMPRPAPRGMKVAGRMPSAPTSRAFSGQDDHYPKRDLASLDLLLSSYTVAYLAFHFLLTFQPWDRYLLPLVPLVSILAARAYEPVFRTDAHADRGATAHENVMLSGLIPCGALRRDSSEASPTRDRELVLNAVKDSSLVSRRGALFAVNPLRTCPEQSEGVTAEGIFRTDAHAGRGVGSKPPSALGRRSPSGNGVASEWCADGTPLRCVPDYERILRTVAGAGLALLLAYAAWLGMAGRLPVGSDHGAFAGLAQAATILRDQPADAVIYHHSLGWHFDFYLFDAPQERRWYETPAKLAADAGQADPSRPQWLVLTAWEDADELRDPLADRGLTLAERARIFRPDGSRSFTIYQIVTARGQDGY